MGWRKWKESYTVWSLMPLLLFVPIFTFISLFYSLILSFYFTTLDLTIFSGSVETGKHSDGKHHGEKPKKAQSVISPHLTLSVFVQLSMLNGCLEAECPDWHCYFNEHTQTHACTHARTPAHTLKNTEFASLLHLRPARHKQREVRGWGRGLLDRGWM